jgi:hypothetical protein
MMKHLDMQGVKEKIESETGANEAVGLIFQRFASSDKPFEIDPAAGGLELISLSTVKGNPNRCRLKVWQPKEKQLLAWFFKKSAVPHSRDRFSYGGVVWDLDSVDPSKVSDEIDSWVEWVDSGLNPDKRPSNWISAFDYDIPE